MSWPTLMSVSMWKVMTKISIGVLRYDELLCLGKLIFKSHAVTYICGVSEFYVVIYCVIAELWSSEVSAYYGVISL